MRPGYLLRVSFLYVYRSWRSTVVLGIMIAFAVAALVFLSSLAVGTNDAMVRNSVGLFSGHVVANHLPWDFQANLSHVLEVEGVQRVLVRRKQPAWLWSGDRTEPVLLFGIQPSDERAMTFLWRKTTAGRYLEDGESTVYLSETMAERLQLRIGDRVPIGLKPGTTVIELTLCGIYRTGILALDQGIAFCPRQVLPDTEGDISAAVFLKSGADHDSVVTKLRSLPGSPHFHAWPELMPDLKQLIDLNFLSMGIVMVLVFGIVSLSISCAFVIYILKNLKEHGIMKAMGVLPSESAGLILTQVTLLTVLASLAGTAIGALIALIMKRVGIDLTAFTSHNQYFVVSGVIYPRLTAYSLCIPAVTSILFGIMAAIWPSVFVIREKAAEILRSL